jgi:hypothetical protein
VDQFDLNRLTDFDFEEVVKDVVEVLLGGDRLEIFAAGKDQGVDLRALATTGGSVVVQCKHWHRSGRDALIRHYRTSESAKVEKLAPDRYILATSADLTVGSKKTLAGLLSPWVKTEADILGVAELVAELRTHPEIVKRHFRLWLSSAQVLETMLARELHVRSGQLVSELEDTLRVFAPTPKFGAASDILDNEHVCIIAGAPGIGKTTLAQVLTADYLSRGFEVYELSGDVDEANKEWDAKRPQLFYYDDFLGQTSLRDTVTSNEDSRLVRFIKEVRRSPNKRFVLTSREYILAQARQQSEKLAHAGLDLLKLVLDLGTYDTETRARVLYNHIYFSKLPPENRAYFADADAYMPILEHPNFSPRLVALTFDDPASVSETPEESAKRLKRNLDSPGALWRHMFEYQLKAQEVDLVELLFTLDGQLTLAELQERWSVYSRAVPRGDVGRELNRALGAMEGTLVRLRAVGSGDTRVFLHNPSVRDFMRDRVAGDQALLKKLFKGMTDFSQFQVIWAMSNSPEGQGLGEALKRTAPVIAVETERVFDRTSPDLDSDIWPSALATLIELAGWLSTGIKSP